MQLKDLPIIPGLELFIIIKHPNNDLTFKSMTINLQKNIDSFIWEVQQAEKNTLEFHQWKWNKLRIGIIVILSLLSLSLILQSIRLKMGFGFPELPP